MIEKLEQIRKEAFNEYNAYRKKRRAILSKRNTFQEDKEEEISKEYEKYKKIEEEVDRIELEIEQEALCRDRPIDVQI